MKTVQFKIEGVSPLLINRFTEAAEDTATMRTAKKEYGTPREQAEKTAYVDDKGKLWVPSTWVKGALQCVASDYKLPKSRKSVKSVSGGAIIPTEDALYFQENYTMKDLEVDSRPVVIQRARIMRHRARLEKWTLKGCFEIDDEILKPENVNEMLVSAGRRVGVGDFRPQKGGPFGRFQVVEWKIIKS